MSIDVKTFRRAMGCFATGVVVVTATMPADGAAFGITINSVTSVSLKPPLLLFCLQRTSRFLPALTRGREFAVNVLSAEQESLSQNFSTAASQRRWDGLSISHGPDGETLLDGCLVHLLCTMEAAYDGGDHEILVGRVRSIEMRADGNPLIYFRGRYGRLGSGTETN
ncbi:MAG: flavin reductase family protein [Rhodospirillaceae bacterium]